MYYYITEAPRSRDDHRALERARELLTLLGIAGEFVTASPTRSVAELAELGAAKRYSTIVAIGSERLINEVATLLAGTPYVFGALPLQNPVSLELVTGITTLEEAAEALKYRRVKLTSIARIEPNKFFVTEIKIAIAQATPIHLAIDDASIETNCSDIRLAGSGTIFLRNRFGDRGKRSFLNWLFGGKKEETGYTSRFRGSKISIEMDGTYPVYLGSEVIAKTPLAIQVFPRSLKMITRRDRVSPPIIRETERRPQFSTTNG
ncbi:hypothetical protein HYW32_04290 [Candidatus Berkelbacteria bacterium]|nr:hypothetical protein [Candidatus Berkelbacteria bacterium]